MGKIKKFIKNLRKVNEQGKCNHENAYYFHENAPMYCPDCKKYIDGGNVICNY